MSSVKKKTQGDVTLSIAPSLASMSDGEPRHCACRARCTIRPFGIFKWSKEPTPATKKAIVAFGLPPIAQKSNLKQDPGSFSTLSVPSQGGLFDSAIFFDWDDTLCPSSWIRTNRPKLDYLAPCPKDAIYTEPLSQLSSLVCELLTIAADHGNVIIVTNSQVGWVKTSCANFMPDVYEVIRDLQVKVVYSRGTEDPSNPAIPTKWKADAFNKVLNELGQSVDNIVSVGDQIYERDAARKISKSKPGCKNKTVKLIEDPSIADLISQVNYLKDSIGRIASLGENFDADFTLQ